MPGGVAGDESAVVGSNCQHHFTERAFTTRERDDITRVIPAGRLGTVEEVASLVAWLVSEENSYLCGQNLLIDGGPARSDTQRWFAVSELEASESNLDLT